jgi:NAD-dependent SIR2 family protein deacetylase
VRRSEKGRITDKPGGTVLRKIKNQATGPKATAWKNFSKYIRARDCLATTGSLEYCKCITCGEIVPAERIDAGHMIGGRSGGILFDETIVFGQCIKCNREGGGQYEVFKRIMIERNGEEWYAEKLRNKKEVVLHGDDGYRLISKHYLSKYNQLIKDY